MKWKIGAALMALVLVIGMIPVVRSADGTGRLTAKPARGEHEIVMQIGESRALLDGAEVALVDDAGAPTAPLRTETGVVTVPLGVLTEGLGISATWDDSGKSVTLGYDAATVMLMIDSADVTVSDRDGTRAEVLPCAISTENWAVYVPVAEIIDLLGCHAEVLSALEGDLILLSTEKNGPSERARTSLYEHALELFGPTYEMVSSNALIVRKHSAHALVNGEIVELEAQVLASGEVNSEAAAGLWIPVSAASQLTGGTVTYDAEKNRLQGEDGTVDVTIFQVEDVLYCEVAKIGEVVGTSSSLIANFTVGVLTPYAYQTDADVVARLETSAGDLPEVTPPIPEAEHYIALTFDDGPTGGEDGLTMRLLDGLKERGAHATFFLCGYRIKDFNLMMDRYLAEGHEIGNHTYDHKDLPSLSRDGIRKQVADNDDLIRSYVGQPSTVVRCVGGNYNTTVKEVMAELGQPIIQWSVDTLDWKIRDADNICDVIVDNAKDGDIVLMHDLRDCTLEGALRAIDILSERGYAFVTVSELAQIKGVELQPGVVYNSFN